MFPQNRFPKKGLIHWTHKNQLGLSHY